MYHSQVSSHDADGFNKIVIFNNDEKIRTFVGRLINPNSFATVNKNGDWYAMYTDADNLYVVDLKEIPHESSHPLNYNVNFRSYLQRAKSIKVTLSIPDNERWNSIYVPTEGNGDIGFLIGTDEDLNPFIKFMNLSNLFDIQILDLFPDCNFAGFPLENNIMVSKENNVYFIHLNETRTYGVVI